MPICPSCGAASPDPAATCANCGRPVAAPAIGDVIEDAGSAAAGPSPWGAGRIHHTRETPLLSRGWLTAGRVLIAPTALLVLAAAIGSGTSDGGDSTGPFATAWSTEGFQTWLALVLTGLGAPLRMVITSPGGKAATISGDSHLIMYAVSLGWLLTLWTGLHLVARGRRRAALAEPAPAAAGLQALRTGALSAAVALLLGWLAGHDTDLGSKSSALKVEIGPELLPLTLTAGLAAAAVVLAVDGAAALRAEAARRGWLGSLLLAWQHASRVLLGLLALLTAVALVVQLSGDRTFPHSDTLGLAVNNGLLIHGVGSGASLLTAGVFGFGHESMSLFDLGGHGDGWWCAALLPLAAALALGWSAHRGRLAPRDRAVLAGLYAALTAVLLLGTSMWATQSRSGAGAGGLSLQSRDTLGWSVVSVLVAAAVWALFGALVVPAVLDAVRGTPVPPHAPAPLPAPAAPPAVPPLPAAPPPLPAAAPALPVLPGQTVTDTLAHGSVELVPEEPPAPAVALDKDGDPHAAYRRPVEG
ncbi:MULTISPECIES: zinc ribbon domain-containing protein [Kitasatospora]|uniref:Zinc-ribbon domain-containing protein n=1 Tax=Kitasatospora setae (strain ATCC 33774 / DSM 43861 / JCM 3304 / KCC A-0304 / NBRC 14216 / KM-6054) TaxID=452652 RepID=E4NCH6_KITSK|nr:MULTISPECIES: zinc ribbon domain-containing protein [Kitasatospora]BAJ28907.1 hypothetical protein KSE_30970 [Kitasatospora setae KM-6054]